MKSNNALASDVTVHGAQESGNFTIDANGKAFKILIDGLYSNKIQAIVRELSSNAYDAQIAAGRSDFAFDIQLPNLLDPIFSVRDYGTSLIHEDIMGLYTTVFRSTKENTNLAIGKFGLGSKTPFAYTDSFTVTAFLRGTKRIYGAYINPNGIPQISLMMSEDTDELDGLMVSFPVNSKDCERFRSETEKVLEGFDVMPNVRGGEVTVEKYAIVHTGSNFKILTNGGARAKQGCVIYPLDKGALGSLTKAQLDILNSNILIDFPVGQLDITPSRESLSYDDNTIKNIIDMVDKIHEELVRDIAALFAKVRTMHEARCFVALHKTSPIKAISNYAAHLRFNNKPVYPATSMARDKLRQVYGVGITQISDHNIRHEKPIRFNDKEYATKWEVDEDTMFLVEDYTKDKHVKLIKARIHNNLGRHKNIVWVRDYERDPKKWRSFLRLLGFPPKFYKLEDFVLPEREKLDRATFAPRIKKNEVRIIRFDRYEDVVDLNTLPSNTRYVISHNGTLWVDENYDNYVYEQTVRNLFEDTSNILVVKQKSLNKVKAAGVTNALTERRDDLARDLDFESFVAKSNLEKYLNHWIKDYASELSTLEYESDTSFKKVLDFMRKYVKTESTEQSENAANIMLWQKLVTSTVFYAKQNEFTIPKPEDDETLSYWVGKIVEEYPLTKKYIGKHWDDGTFSSDLEHIFNYIKMVDKFNAENCVS